MKLSQILCTVGLIIGLLMAMLTYSCTLAAEGLKGAARGLNNVQNKFAGEVAREFGIDVPDVYSNSSDELNEQFDSVSKELAKMRIILIASIFIVIIAGVPGIIGPNKRPVNIKERHLAIILGTGGIILLPLGNFISAVLYIIAAVLYFLHGKNGYKPF